MTDLFSSMESVQEVFPQSFSFFSYGRVVLNPKITEQRFNPQAIIKFALSGDQEGEFIVSFSRTCEDLSMLAEMGNILVAKLINGLADAKGLRLELSPPLFLDPQEKGFETHAGLMTTSKTKKGYFFEPVDSAFSLGPCHIVLMFIEQRSGLA